MNLKNFIETIYNYFYKKDIRYNFTEEEYYMYLECDYKIDYESTK